MGGRYAKSDENKKIIYKDATNLYGHSISQTLPFDEIEFDRNFCLKEILCTPDDNEIGYFLEFDLRHPYNIRQKTKYFPFVPESKIISKDDFNDYMKKKLNQKTMQNIKN